MAQKVFRDPIHNIMALELASSDQAPWDFGDELLLQLIDTPEVQRLRRIAQLGLASRIYPAAEHSRFSHALGVMHLAKRMVMVLMRRHPGVISRELALQIKVAGLLHDIGHGPFSHVFEEVYPNAPRHEAWGRAMLARPGGLGEILREYARQQGWPPAFLLDGVMHLATDAPLTGSMALGRQVIASQLDADRMDYLLRDAHFTGVQYGRYDLEWLLHSLQVAEVEGSPRLCVDISRGPSALESYITSRDHMYRQVYDHKTVRAFETLLTLLFRAILCYWRQEGSPPPATPAMLTRFLDQALHNRTPDVADYLALDDHVLDYALACWAAMPAGDHPLLADIIWKSRMLRNRQPVLRRLRWRSGHSGETSDIIEDPDLYHRLATFFEAYADTPVPIIQPDGATATLPVKLVVLVDRLERTPYAHLQYPGGVGSDPIFVLTRGGRVMPAEQASVHLDFLGRARLRLARVFVDPRALAGIVDLIRLHDPQAVC